MKKLIMGNWKMNGGLATAENLAKSINIGSDNVDVIVFPPAIYANSVKNSIDNNISVGLQNMSDFDDGAYTGEISAKMLLDIGCNSVLLGHSERRAIFNETDIDVFNKTKKAIAENITPVICIGESLEDRKSGKLEATLTKQLEKILGGFSKEELAKMVIAYEPVWAIGTGVVASLEQIQETHSFIRSLFAKIDLELAKSLKIVYGGSLKASNANEILKLDDIDGGLIGGASLKASEFNEIINQANIICTE